MDFEISSKAVLPTKFGNFVVQSFREYTKNIDGRDTCLEHLVASTANMGDTPLVRIHSECLTGDAFFSQKCDCGGELELALKLISQKGGMLVYLRQEGRGIGLFNKINAYALQDKGMDTVEANEALGFPKDARSYDIVEEIFKHYNLTQIELLTNNPRKVEFFSKFLKVKRSAIIVDSNPHNKAYLEVKRDKLGHML